MNLTHDKLMQAKQFEVLERLLAVEATRCPAANLDFTLISLAYNTGLRVSEIVALRWEDVNDDHLVVRKGKGDKTRTVVVGKRTKQLLERWAAETRNNHSLTLSAKARGRGKASSSSATAPGNAPSSSAKARTPVNASPSKGRERGRASAGESASPSKARGRGGAPASESASPFLAGLSGPLFLGQRGPLGRTAVHRRFKKWIERAGLPSSLSFHSLRHGFATRLLNGGVSLPAVRDLLGHSSISVTSVYLHFTEEETNKVKALL